MELNITSGTERKKPNRANCVQSLQKKEHPTDSYMNVMKIIENLYSSSEN